MQPYPVSIDRYFFTRFCVVSNPDHVPEGNGMLDSVRIDSSLDVKQPDDGGNVYIAEQRVKMDAGDNPNIPYTLDIECIGFFNVDPATEEDQKHLLVLRVAHNVLYAAIREAILMATSRQVWGPLSIGLSILQPKDEKIDKAKASKVTKKRTPNLVKV